MRENENPCFVYCNTLGFLFNYKYQIKDIHPVIEIIQYSAFLITYLSSIPSQYIA